MLRLAQERERSRDRRPVGRPTGADLIADVTAHAMRQVALPTGCGLYHLVAQGETTGMPMPAM
jgi:dTDP-4-dehydrorhamnose reductase